MLESLLKNLLPLSYFFFAQIELRCFGFPLSIKELYNLLQLPVSLVEALFSLIKTFFKYVVKIADFLLVFKSSARFR